MSWLSSLKSVFSPSKEVNEEAVQNVLQNYILPNSSNALKDRITQVNVQGEILQITLNTYPEEKAQLQQIHDELAEALQKCGIQELNMHVIQQKTGHKKKVVAGITMLKVKTVQASLKRKQNPIFPLWLMRRHSLPKTEEADPNNPPIQKAAPQQRDVPKHPRIQNVILVSSR